MAVVFVALGQGNDPAPKQKPAPAVQADAAAPVLTSRPLPKRPELKQLKIGEEIQTGARERLLLALPDGTALYVNENTQVKLEGANKLVLAAGEIFVEQHPAAAAKAVTVQAPKRQLSSKDSSFAVQAQEEGTAVMVTRGQVKVGGLEKPLHSGQMLAPDGKAPARAARPAQLLHWTQELMAAAEPALVPASQHAGGALVAVDPAGQESKLSLRKYHIDVHVEDGFARTTIDQTYFNHENFQTEGTFYFPLPPDASLSRLAMYVEGELMEGGMVERNYGQEVYETIKYMKRDPALLEWVDGSTFKMRVFPLEARKEKRIILSYVQKLPAVNGQAQYRFPAGHSMPAVKDWSLNIRVKGGAAMACNSPSHKLATKKDQGDLVLTAEKKNALFNKDVVLLVHNPALADKGAKSVFAVAEHEGHKYLMAALRPDLLRQEEVKPQAAAPRHWLFLFESSGDRDPLLARVQIEVMRHLLLHASPEDTFNVLAANTKVRALGKTPQPVSAEAIQEAVTFLEGSHLIGALDLAQAFNQAANYTGKQASNTFVVHLGGAIPAMGERRLDVLAKSMPEGAGYIGVGIGKRWNRSLMKAAAENTGGYFTQINPDDSIGWRSFELASTLQALGPPGLRKVEITGIVPAPAKMPQFLYFNQLLAQGEELCAVTRLDGKAALPKGLKLKYADGQEVEVPIQQVKKEANYLPRMWAKLEIDRLLAKDVVKHKDDIIKLSKAMYVMSPFTSLLVLENEDMYKQFGVDKGRKDHWAMYPAPQKIEVVFEPDPNSPIKGKNAKSPEQVLNTIAVLGKPKVLAVSTGSEPVLGTDFDGDGPDVNFPAVITNKQSAMNDVMKLPAMDAFAIAAGEKSGKKDHFKLLDAKGQHAPDGWSGQQFGFGANANALLGIDKLQTDKSPAGLHKGKPASLTAYAGDSGAKLFLGGMALDGKEAGRSTIHERAEPWATPPPAKRQAVLEEYLSEAERKLTPDEKAAAIVNFGKLYRSNGGKHGEAVATNSGNPFLYSRPSYTGSDANFYNLLAYAPGLNTNIADMMAVLETEAFFHKPQRLGKIDAGARDLIDKARQAGWQKLTVPGKEGQPEFSIVFDGQGRFAYAQTLSPGLMEQVANDGKAITHVYSQLGLAGKRNVSRFHRAAFTEHIPWFVAPPEDLARGADVKLVDERTVDIVPHHGAAKPTKKKDGAEPAPITFHIRLVFADGMLAQRQLVEMPKNKVLLRQVCTAKGSVRWLDGKDKELSAAQAKLTPAEEPNLTLETKELIVLDLPYRTPEHIRQTLKIEKKGNNELTFAQATTLLAAYVASGNGNEARNIFLSALHNRNQRQLGYYVLLAAGGQDLGGGNLNVVDDHPDAPLAQYLALHTSPVLRQQASQWAIGSVQWKDPMLKHLATSHALFQRWQSKQVEKWNAERLEKERDQALKYVRDNKNSAFGWVMLSLLQHKAGEDKAFYSELAKHWKMFQQWPALSYAARYEQARCQLEAGQLEEARKLFAQLYEDTFKDGALPPLDSDFRTALLSGKAADGWSQLLQGTAKKLIEDKHRPAVLALAWQCWQLNDAPQADQLVQLALTDIKEQKERDGMQLAAVLFYRQTKQLPQADKLLGQLLEDPKLAQNSDLWRLAGNIAGQRNQTARSIECLEKALDLEFKDLPEVINLKQVRQDYRKVLDHYQGLADSLVALKMQPPQGFLAKVVKTADRWRALDAGAKEASNTTAAILRTLGNNDLAWDYLTTPIGMQPNEPGPWLNLASNLRLSGETNLADLAYKAAFETEPTNAQALWDRAENLQQAGKTTQAQSLYRQIAEGHWGPQYAGLVSQAKLRTK
jgi:predicted Zn-dependent protease